MDVLVEILSSCCGRDGCRWHFLAPCNLRHSPCGFLYNRLCLSANDTSTSSVIFLWWLVIVVTRYPSKSKPQSAGITSSANPANLLINRYLQTSSFCFTAFFREFRERSQNSSSELVFFLIFRRGTTRLRQSCRSLWQLLFLLKRQFPFLLLRPYHAIAPVPHLRDTVSLR